MVKKSDLVVKNRGADLSGWTLLRLTITTFLCPLASVSLASIYGFRNCPTRHDAQEDVESRSMLETRAYGVGGIKLIGAGHWCVRAATTPTGTQRNSLT